MVIENKGIIYYKLDKDFHYEGDYTKNCGLSGGEIDGNFNFLRGYDISSFDISENKEELIISRLNGQKLKIDIKECFSDYNFEYDTENGVLKVEVPYGKTFDLKGFLTKYDIKVYSDDTIDGDGSKNKPLTVSNTVRTGTYRPAKKVIDTSKDKLSNSGVSKYERYVTKENVSKFGLLYSLSGVKEIEKRLRAIDSEWRVPTKEDWDILLNSVETYPENRNHNMEPSPINAYLGYDAGAALKTFNEWTPYYKKLDDGEVVLAGKRYTKSSDSDYVVDTNGEYIKIYMSKNKYGFSIYPVGGSVDGVDDIGKYGDFTSFWTLTENGESGNVFVKTFTYDDKRVRQDVYGDNAFLSVRLVKDFNGNNYNDG